MPVFSFLNPSFLWALPVTSIPVLIHLLSRRRLPEVSFPTTQFLRSLEPREIRRLRLREILLLILRTLALLFLVLAFARPTVTPQGAATHAAAAVGVLLDDSESMGALDERARPRIERAKEAALTVADAGRPGDELYLALATRPDDPEAERARDRVRLRRAVDAVEAAPLPARLAPALRKLRLALARNPLPARELYLVSDFQRANLDAAARAEIADAARAGIRVLLVPVARGRTPNHGFAAVDPEARPGPDGRGLEVRALLENHADAPADRLALRVRRGDALIGGGDATLEAGAARWIPMPLEERALSDSGGTSVIVESDEDALPIDDRWYAVLGAPKRIRVLRIAESRGGTPPPRFATLALDPSGDGSTGFLVETGSPALLASLSTSRADAVLLDDVASLSADAEARVRAFVKDGGGLVVALGPHADPDYYAHHLFPGLIDLALSPPEHAPEGAAFELRARVPGHPVLEGLAVGVGSPLTQARLIGLVRGRPTSPRAEVVVQTTGGFPVVVTAPGVSVFLSSLADDWGDLPYSGAFVPLVRGLVASAVRATGSTIASPRVGERPVARLAAAPSGALLVRGPGGYTSSAAVEAEGTSFRAVADAPAPAPGFYTFETGARPIATVAVNVDPVESDLAAVPGDSIAAGATATSAPRAGMSGASAPRAGTPRAAVTVLANPRALAGYLRDTRRGRELWLPFLVVGALLLMGELALGSARALRP
ncbi:MAG: BatA domain-containing protein [Hyphomicrobiales bacterium]